MAVRRIRPSDMVIGLAVAGLIGTTLGAVALAWPETGLAGATGLAPVNERRADALARAAEIHDAHRLAAGALTRLSLAEAPANPTAWLRLAYLDALADGTLTQVGERALAMSYSVAPYGPDVTAWRLDFAFDHWSALSETTRTAAVDELMVTHRGLDHSGLRGSTSDPAGQLALDLLLNAAADRAAPKRVH